MDANMPKMKQNRSNCFDGNRVESVVKPRNSKNAGGGSAAMPNTAKRPSFYRIPNKLR